MKPLNERKVLNEDISLEKKEACEEKNQGRTSNAPHRRFLRPEVACARAWGSTMSSTQLLAFNAMILNSYSVPTSRKC